ncbi:MAG: CPBP family intramembrane metalloprotease [Proteobacteria bacterium]|nr:CPBP family intramembrane metalloprotease [Pseudomonadota bacterium]
MTPDPPEPPRNSPWGRSPARPRRPLGIPGALALLGLWTLATLANAFPGLTGGVLLAPLPQALATIILLTALAIFRWPDTALGLPRPGTLRLFWLPLLYLPLFAAGIVATGGIPAPLLISLTAAMVWVALSEELMFRGLLFPAFRRRLGPWPAIWLTSLLFGAIHLGNGWTAEMQGLALAQSLAAVSTGLVLLAMRLRSGSIWLPMVYHLLWNIGSFGLDLALTGRGSVPGWLADPDPLVRIAVSLGFVLPNGLYALWLMRGVGRGHLPGDVAGAGSGVGSR